MGADTIIANLIFFIAVMGMSVAVVIFLTNYVTETTSAAGVRQKNMVDQLQTDIDISVINASAENSQVYVKNIGKTDLRTDCIDVYIDKNRQANTSFQVLDPDTGSGVSIWLPMKTVMINVTHAALSADKTHEVQVFTCNSVGDSYLFSI